MNRFEINLMLISVIYTLALNLLKKIRMNEGFLISSVIYTAVKKIDIFFFISVFCITPTLETSIAQIIYLSFNY